MNRGLRYLLVRSAIGKVRQLRRRFRGIKGFLLGTGIVLMAALVIGPQLFVHLQQSTSEDMTRIAAAVRGWVPGVLLFGMAIVGMSKGALYFRPEEIQFLFPAPISRRQLLWYNVLARLRLQSISALWCSIFIFRFAGSIYGAILAAFFVLTFLQLTAQTGGLFLAAMGERLARPVKIVAWIVLLAVVSGAFLAMRASLGADAHPADVVRAILAHPVAQTASWLTRPFVETYLAASFLDVLRWSILSLAILGLEIGVMMALDVAYMEGALLQGRKFQARLERMRSGGGAFSAFGPSKARFTLPAFPRAGGAGPLAWRQCLEMTRNLRGVLMVGFMMFVWLGMFFLLPGIIEDKVGGDAQKTDLSTFGLVIAFTMTSMMTMHFPFDFRRDLDRMSRLKALPLRSIALVAGQIFPTALLLFIWQALGLVVITVANPGVEPMQFLTLLCLLPLLNWLVSATDNATFLLFPYRLAVKDPGNLPFMGRIMLVMTVKSLILGILFAAAALAGFLLWRYVAEEWLLVLAGSGTILLIACIPVTLWAAAAFEEFDVAKDVPG